MKVKIKPYANYYGTYQIVEPVLKFFKFNEDTIDAVANYCANTRLGEYYNHIAGKIMEYNENNRYKIVIDDYDTYNVDLTLAHIIVPLLKRFKEKTNGAPFVPFELRPDHLIPKDTQVEPGFQDEFYFEAWDYALDEMIFAFNSKLENWEDQFYSGEADYDYRDLPNGLVEVVEGKNHSHKFDKEGYTKYYDRIQKGFDLFGHMYQSLWW